jgi:hypothetical protein
LGQRVCLLAQLGAPIHGPGVFLWGHHQLSSQAAPLTHTPWVPFRRARAMPLVIMALAAACGHLYAYALGSLPGFLFLVMCVCLLLELDVRRRRGGATLLGHPF